jgi:hypothetical protein
MKWIWTKWGTLSVMGQFNIVKSKAHSFLSTRKGVRRIKEVRWGYKDGKNEKARQWELNYEKTNYGNCHSDRMNRSHHCHKTIGEVLGMELFLQWGTGNEILTGEVLGMDNTQWGTERIGFQHLEAVAKKNYKKVTFHRNWPGTGEENHGGYNTGDWWTPSNHGSGVPPMI